MVLSAAPAQPLPSELLALLDVLIVNEIDCRSSPENGRRRVALRSIDVPRVVVTLGAKVLTATLAAAGSVNEGLRAANAAAALACTRHGAQPSIPTQTELRASSHNLSAWYDVAHFPVRRALYRTRFAAADLAAPIRGETAPRLPRPPSPPRAGR